MKYPCLVPVRMCKTPISITIQGENITEDGAPETVKSLKLNCNYQDGGRKVFTREQKHVYVSGVALFTGDIAPDIPNITAGYALIHGERRDIIEGFKARNPDGSVNYTEVRFA